jgi:hypothetical protein
MNLKSVFFLTVLLAHMSSCNNSNSAKIPKKETAEYQFAVPKGWTVERIPFPIEFAPGIPYKGFEELRFAPGWEFTANEEHWSYGFLWWLEGKPNISAEVLQQNLNTYYFGLLSRNIRKRNIPAAKVISPVATIKKIETAPGDTETYRGTISMLDYLDIMHNTITLNCLVHKKDCNTHTALIYEISPKPLEHKIWQQLNNLEDSFRCN